MLHPLGGAWKLAHGAIHSVPTDMAINSFVQGLFSPEQLYILDEFCARYGVRDPFRHFTCLREWMAREEEGISIWPVMLLSSFRFCQMHVGGIK